MCVCVCVYVYMHPNEGDIGTSYAATVDPEKLLAEAKQRYG